ncbi:conserved hypothetical protein [Mesorhizobium plurifarium]|uniref:Arc-like DNA binding domain-containing protein n=1 Tax=Mesorhizobium plurifarium TaxID=69974 RepID=A0A090EFX9_MESPL|nr:conserved hypothetical protein [Mesorhizobium plurifarium]
MSEPPSFHLRLPARLKDQLQSARGDNSLNREIIDRLEFTFADPDSAFEIAKTLRPLMRTLSHEDQKILVTAMADVVAVLVKGRRKRS